MTNPYRPTSPDSSDTLLHRHVALFVLAGMCATTITLLSVVMALHLVNQYLQFVPTETTFFLGSINGILVSNISVAVTFLAIGGFFAIVAFLCLRRARRNYLNNSTNRVMLNRSDF